MNWSEEKLGELIELYKINSNLWNPKDCNYFKKNMKTDSWNLIASTLGETADTCKAKISSLLSSYRREKLKEKKSKGTGKGTSEIYTSRWFGYEALRFLDDRDRPKTSLNTETGFEETIAEDSEQNEEIDLFDNSDQTTKSPSTSCTPANNEKPSLEIPKAKRRKSDDTNTIMKDALKILQTTAGKIESPTQDNEIKAFSNFITAKMAKYSRATRMGVQHAIFQIMMQADFGHYEPPTQNNNPYIPPTNLPPPYYYQPQPNTRANSQIQPIFYPPTPNQSKEANIQPPSQLIIPNQPDLQKNINPVNQPLQSPGWSNSSTSTTHRPSSTPTPEMLSDSELSNFEGSLV